MRGRIDGGAPVALEAPDRATVERSRAAIRTWYAANARPLAFRRTTDPWQVLVSEVMLQQTQVWRVVEPWRRFVERFPTPASLAAATPAEVLVAWSGLGYNRRAVNLQRAARAVVERHDGRIPAHPDVLAELPGVGRYTARAVAAIAFGRPVAPVDTNVRRVVARVAFGTIEASEATPRAIEAAADRLIDPTHPGDWVHAVMDVGSTLCRPVRPRCEACPLRPTCRAASAETPASRSARSRPSDRRVPNGAFAATSRWLRGRIVAALVATPRGEWLPIEGPIGLHDARAVIAALESLMRDGMVELRPDGHARLPGEQVARPSTSTRHG